MPSDSHLTPAGRRVLALDLCVNTVALFLFAWLPPTEVLLAEIVTMVCAALCIVGILAHASIRFRLPWDQWSYLLTGVLGMFVLGAYGTAPGIPYFLKIPFCAFVLAGSVSAYAAHVIDGGRRNV